LFTPIINFKKIFFLVISILLISILLISIIIFVNKNKYYISMTITHESEEEGQYESDIIIYDILKDDSDVIVSLPYTSQYPLTVYDKRNNKVFFTANALDNHGDEIFFYDCNNGNIKQLTNDFFAINYIFPSKDGLYIGGVLRGSHTTINPFFYSYSQKKLIKLMWNEDYFINSMNGSRHNNEIYFSCFSEKEEEKYVDEEIDGVDNSVYKCVDKKIKFLFKTKKNYVETLAVNDDILVYRCGDRTFEPIQKICVKDLKKNTEYNLNLSEEKISEMGDFIGIINNSLFYIVNCYDGENCSCIWKIDLNTKQSECIYKSEKNSRINNAQLMYQ